MKQCGHLTSFFHCESWGTFVKISSYVNLPASFGVLFSNLKILVIYTTNFLLITNQNSCNCRNEVIQTTPFASRASFCVFFLEYTIYLNLIFTYSSSLLLFVEIRFSRTFSRNSWEIRDFPNFDFLYDSGFLSRYHFEKRSNHFHFFFSTIKWFLW